MVQAKPLLDQLPKNLHVRWGHDSASHLKRIFSDADGVGATALKVADSVVDECDARAALDNAPRLLASGTSLASACNEDVQADPCVPDNPITLHAMGLFPRYSMLVLVY